jgi:TonB family protein
MTARRPGTFGAMVAAMIVLATLGGAAELDDILGKPLSPGSVALLVEHAADPRVRVRLTEALKDARPAVRTAAARVVNVTFTRGLLPEVASALAVETDLSAAAEEVHVLVVVGEGRRDEDVLAAARREASFAPAVALALARERGRAALHHLFLLGGLADHTGVDRFVLLATRGEPEALAEAGALALRENHPGMWRAALDVARDKDVALDDALLAAGLTAASPEVRAATLWHLVLAAPQPSPRLVKALEASREAGQSDHAGGRLAFEMVQRRLGRLPGKAEEWVAALQDRGPAGPPYELSQHSEAQRRLTPAELSALSERFRGDARELHEELRRPEKDPRRPQPRAAEAKRAMPLRMPGGFPPGLVPDVVHVSGCTLRKNDAFYGGQVTYGPDGRPRQITMANPGDVPAECVRAVKALLFLALADSDRINTAGQPDTLIVPLIADVLTCLGEAPPPARPPVSVPEGRGRIKEPKKVRHVNPWYPAAAQKERVQGVVILEATVGPSGCIRSLEVIRGRDPRLDLVSLVTVAQWRYTPTLLNGVPVPVIMTVTVNFRLR